MLNPNSLAQSYCLDLYGATLWYYSKQEGQSCFILLGRKLLDVYNGSYLMQGTANHYLI